MATNDSFKKISFELSKFDEVELIYYTISKNENDANSTMTYNVVCDISNAISNEKLLRTFVATKELIRTLYSKSNIEPVFNIVTREEFEENVLGNDEYLPYELNNGNILYSKNKVLSSVVKRKR